MPERDAALVRELIGAVGAGNVRTDDAQRALLRRDASVFDGGDAGPVCFPRTAGEVQAVVRAARRHGRAVVPRGAGTGLAGGAIPLGAPVVVSLARMTSIGDV
ncbi:MAG: FAD-binding oxidoreductase, partial [Actinobacteria bacterium]|nr:FAD-binding oxidoreductase [Actinomycetota bacterium]